MNGSGRRTIAFTTLKIALFTPMTSARVNKAIAGTPGCFTSILRPYITSLISEFMVFNLHEKSVFNAPLAAASPPDVRRGYAAPLRLIEASG